MAVFDMHAVQHLMMTCGQLSDWQPAQLAGHELEVISGRYKTQSKPGKRFAGSTRDVLGMNAKTTTDAALVLDVMTGYGFTKFVGQAPVGGYSALFGKTTLQGARIGLYGTGWRNVTLNETTQKLYDSAVEELKELGATVIQDPFVGAHIAAVQLCTGESCTAPPASASR